MRALPLWKALCRCKQYVVFLGRCYGDAEQNTDSKIYVVVLSDNKLYTYIILGAFFAWVLEAAGSPNNAPATTFPSYKGACLFPQMLRRVWSSAKLGSTDSDDEHPSKRSISGVKHHHSGPLTLLLGRVPRVTEGADYAIIQMAEPLFHNDNTDG
jgi:hypothetical protein